MFSSSVILLLGFGILSLADPIRGPSRIVGGSEAPITSYPFSTSILLATDLTNYAQFCGGSILNTRSVLSTAQCFSGKIVDQLRFRVGSSYSNQQGAVYNVEEITTHPNYNPWTLESDVAILRSDRSISFIPNTIAAAAISGANYHIPDETIVYAIGWGRTDINEPFSNHLRHVQVPTVNQWTCMAHYGSIGWHISNNMLCTGWVDSGGRGQCEGDEGSPIVHKDIVIGIRSFGFYCALPHFPGVNVRLSRFSEWIQANA